MLEANTGETVLDVALKNGIGIEHACEKSCSDELLEQGILRLKNSDTKQHDLLINTVTAQIERDWRPCCCVRLYCAPNKLNADLFKSAFKPAL